MRFAPVAAALAVTAMSSTALADFTMVQFGPTYGTAIKTVGGQVGVYYGFRNETDAEFETFRFGIELDGFFPHANDFPDYSMKTTWWDVNGNGHWLFFEPRDFPLAAYLLLGLNVARVTQSFEYDSGVQPREEDTGKWKLGGNIGGGLEYRFSDRVAGYFEGKYVISSADQAVAYIGVRLTLPQRSRVDKL